MRLKHKKSTVVFEAIILIIALQAIRELIEGIVFNYVEENPFNNKMVTMCVMLLLTAVVISYSKLRKTSLSIFPEHFNKKYIIATAIAALILITTPSNYTGGYKAILALIYGSIVTPVYEELIFRGYLWTRLEGVLKKPLYTYIASVILFSVWHIGYMLPLILSGNAFAVMTKVGAGLFYGAVLGFVRIKTKNCYSTILLHGVLNVFMI